MATNAQIKRVHAQDEYTPEMVNELLKCRDDPVYFITKYVKVQHPTRGTIPFALYDYQKRMVHDFQLNQFTCVLTGRQQGKTATAAMFLLWKATFTKDQTILIASKNQSHAMEIAARVRFAYEELPNWIKCGVKYYNRHRIEFDNGSRIICEATTEKTGRGLSVSILFLDELAFINPRIQSELWASIAPTLSTGGSAIITSTPNGDSELFAQLWRGSITNGIGQVGENKFFSTRVYWDEHPDRGEDYYNTMRAQLGDLVCRQEVDGEFLSSDALLINSMVLHKLRSKLPVYTDMGFKFWAEQEKIGGNGKTYLVGIDPATGTGSDYSVIEVFEFPSMIQVAEWRSNEVNVPLLYAKIKWVLEFLSRNIPGRGRSEVIWSYERNGIGESLSALYTNDDKQPEYAELYSDMGNRFGVFTSGQTKINTCIQLKTLVERGTGIFFNSDIILEELKNYVARGSTYDHKTGATGDAVSAVLVVMRLLKRLSEYDEVAFSRVNEYVSPDSPEKLFTLDDDNNHMNLEDTSAGDNEPFPLMFG